MALSQPHVDQPIVTSLTKLRDKSAGKSQLQLNSMRGGDHRVIKSFKKSTFAVACRLHGALREWMVHSTSMTHLSLINNKCHDSCHRNFGSSWSKYRDSVRQLSIQRPAQRSQAAVNRVVVWNRKPPVLWLCAYSMGERFKSATLIQLISSHDY